MYTAFSKTGNIKEDDRAFIEACRLYIEDAHSVFDHISNLSNIAALIYDYLDDINWAGFYLFDGEKLVLGPFQGEPACTRILLTRGVCGAAAREKKTLVVEDVEKFPGHIACSSASKSELVVPLLLDGNLLGVIDIDSPSVGRFSDREARLLEELSSFVSHSLANDWVLNYHLN